MKHHATTAAFIVVLCLIVFVSFVFDFAEAESLTTATPYFNAFSFLPVAVGQRAGPTATDVAPPPTGTVTPYLTMTSTSTVLPTATITPLPSATAVATNTPTTTSTPLPTSTSTPTATAMPTHTATPTATAVATNCDDAYPTVCIPSPPPDLNCGDISFRNFDVLPPDPHGFDGDNDGVGCES